MQKVMWSIVLCVGEPSRLKVDENEIIFPMITKFFYFEEKNFQCDVMVKWTPGQLEKMMSGYLRYFRGYRVTIRWENKQVKYSMVRPYALRITKPQLWRQK